MDSETFYGDDTIFYSISEENDPILRLFEKKELSNDGSMSNYHTKTVKDEGIHIIRIKSYEYLSNSNMKLYYNKMTVKLLNFIYSEVELSAALIIIEGNDEEVKNIITGFSNFNDEKLSIVPSNGWKFSAKLIKEIALTGDIFINKNI